MLLVLKVEGLEGLNINDIEAGKKVTVTGIAGGLYFDDEYIDNFDDELEKNRRICASALKKMKEITNEFSELVDKTTKKN